MTIRLTVEKKSFALTRADKLPVQVLVQPSAGSSELVVRDYRGHDVGASSAAMLRSRLDDADEEHARRMERVRLLKEAAAQPVPALLLSRRSYDGLTPIGVRGVAERTGVVLITHPSGTKGSADPREVLRLLTDDERAELARTHRELAECEATTTKATDLYSAKHALKGDVEVRFDTREDCWRSTDPERPVVGATPREVHDKVEAAVLLSLYSHGVVHDGERGYEAYPLAELVGEDGSIDFRADLFTTREAATRHAAARGRLSELRQEYHDLVEGLRLDLSRWITG